MTQRVNFAALKSYQWQAPAGTTHDPNDLDMQRIERSVHKHMIARGFVLLESGKPDFFVSADHTTQLTAAHSGPRVSTSVGVGGGSRGGFGGVGISIGKTVGSGRDEEKNLLILDIHNSVNQQLLWRGTAEYNEELDLKPEERSVRMDAIVGQMLSEFPPGS